MLDVPLWPPHPPLYRKLRVYAFDPAVANRLETSILREVVLQVPWEDDLQPGPVGEYLEVIDYDPCDQCFYPPVHLNHARLVAQDGPRPEIGNPQFHQAMVYGVAMRVIDTFERALGRRVLWSARYYQTKDGKLRQWGDRFVQRLRIYPHALREPNAYYSPEKKAVLFGCFADAEGRAGVPGGAIFTCLSHDVVAHEMTHAIMDGEHPNYLIADNPDVHAFHEAFADIVALFNHFSMPEALRHQLTRTRGVLREQNLLGELAQEFGLATGQRGSLRSAIGRVNPDTRAWERSVPDPTLLDRVDECHDRGSILVAAVFEAFMLIYERRRERFIRIATGGSGILGDGYLPVPLLEALADEAAKSASHVLRMCIRALDYCPPVDITFGEFLRALLTADADAQKDDALEYRLAFVEAFRAWGIMPPGVRSLSVESLFWEPAPAWMGEGFFKVAEMVEDPRSGWRLKQLEELNIKPDFYRDFDLEVDRRSVFLRKLYYQTMLHDVWLQALRGSDTPQHAEILHSGLGVCLHPSAPKSVRRSRTQPKYPAVEVTGVRPARRVDDRGRSRVDFVVELRQNRQVALDPKDQAKLDSGKIVPNTLTLRGGATLLIDADSGKCRYSIYKHILSERRLENLRAMYERHGPRYGVAVARMKEPFAMLHRS